MAVILFLFFFFLFILFFFFFNLYLVILVSVKYFDFSEIDSHLSDTSSRLKFRNKKQIKNVPIQMHNTEK